LGGSGRDADTLSAVSARSEVASVCPGIDDGRFRRKADIVQRWREMAHSRH
jgi:hypothetical protein